MRKLNLYIETSVYGFYYDEEPHNFNKRKTTIKLFDQIEGGLFNGYLSNIVLRELFATSDLKEKLGIPHFISTTPELEALIKGDEKINEEERKIIRSIKDDVLKIKSDVNDFQDIISKRSSHIFPNEMYIKTTNPFLFYTINNMATIGLIGFTYIIITRRKLIKKIYQLIKETKDE